MLPTFTKRSLCRIAVTNLIMAGRLAKEVFETSVDIMEQEYSTDEVIRCVNISHDMLENTEKPVDFFPVDWKEICLN